MPANFTLTKVASKEYQIDVPGPAVGDVTITKRELSKGVTPPVFNDIGTIPIPIESIPYTGTITFDNDNIYQVESETDPPDANDTVINVVVAEDVEEGLLESIEQVLCSCGCVGEWKPGKMATALYYFNSLALNYYTYLSIVNEQNADEFIFGLLDDNQLSEVATLQLVIDRVAKIRECISDLKDLCKCQ